MEWILKRAEIKTFISQLDLPNNRGIYLLSGTLGSGKTTLVQEMVSTLGSSAQVTSPTYLTAIDYGGGIYHYDIYQKDLHTLLSLGFLEEIERQGWHFVEWGDENLAKILKEIGLHFWQILITITEKEKRTYTIEEYLCTH